MLADGQTDKHTDAEIDTRITIDLYSAALLQEEEDVEKTKREKIRTDN